jgi:hypothetical protein
VSLSPSDLIIGFGPFLFFLLCFLAESLSFPVGVFLFVVRPPFLYLFLSGLVTGIFLLVDGSSFGFADSSWPSYLDLLMTLSHKIINCRLYKYHICVSMKVDQEH